MTLLGQGPVAEVHAAGGSALKVFPGRFDRRTLAAIERDRAALAALPGPILPIDGVELVDGRHALRMELCAESLAGRVKRGGPLPADEVAALGAALSRALGAAHRTGVVHGGVSPTNVLYRMNGEPVLADFGLELRQAFRRDPLSGIEWVSPETLRTGVSDARTDLYGLGAVLHFALTGQSPHPSRIGEMTGERILRVITDPVPAISRPDVPVGLSTAIGRLLAPQPANRSIPSTWDTPAEGRPRTALRRWPVAAAAAAAAATAGIFFWWPHFGTVSSAPPATSASAPAPTNRAVAVELAEPTDLGDAVTLTWTTTDDRLFFAVVYWAEGEPRATLLAERNHTLRVPVDPARRYCFLVRGTNPEQLVESQRRAVRGAACRT